MSGLAPLLSTTQLEFAWNVFSGLFLAQLFAATTWALLARPWSIQRIVLIPTILVSFGGLQGGLKGLWMDDYIIDFIRGVIFEIGAIDVILSIGFAISMRLLGFVWTYRPPDAPLERYPSRRPFQFTLREMFIWTAEVAVLAAAVRYLWPHDASLAKFPWTDSFSIGTTVAVCAVTFWAVVSSGSPLLRWTIPVATYALTAVGLAFFGYARLSTSLIQTATAGGWTLVTFALVRATGYRLHRRRRVRKGALIKVAP